MQVGYKALLRQNQQHKNIYNVEESAKDITKVNIIATL